MVIFCHCCSKRCQFSMNFQDNSKNKNRKIDFSYVSAYSASLMKTGSKLRRGGRTEVGVFISLVGTGPNIQPLDVFWWGVKSHTKKNWISLKKKLKQKLNSKFFVESVEIYMKDAECGEANEKSIFLFFIFQVIDRNGKSRFLCCKR